MKQSYSSFLKTVLSALLFCFVSIIHAQINPKEVSGTVLNEKNEPLSYSNIYIKDTNIGTVANSNGDFSIKIAPENFEKILVISNIGYAPVELDISSLDLYEELEIQLATTTYVLNPVNVTNADLILANAMKRIPYNYPQEYVELTTFYRELIKKNRSYVDITQGILNVSKAPYQHDGSSKYKSYTDINVHKGHRMTNYSGRDTLAFKVMGGPNTMMLLDIVKNPGSILGDRYLSYYDYHFEGIDIVDGRRAYVLRFEKKEDSESNEYLYEGTIYIDEETLGIAGLKFGFPESFLKEAGAYLVQQKPSLATLSLEHLAYDVRYRKSGDLWFLDYVRNEIEMKVNWKRRLFNSRFNATMELVVTNKQPSEKLADKKNKKTRTAYKQLFSNQISGLFDTEYWEDFSIIKPEEDLRKAMTKIARN